MSDVTTSSMHDARDAEDQRLLAAGETNALVQGYFETIIQRCRVRCRNEDDAMECVQLVVLRLLSELKRGRRYVVPYRVVVNQVITWTTKGYYAGDRAVLIDFADEIPDEVVRPGNPYSEVETRYDLERALAEVSPGDREAARLRYLEGVEPEEIAQRLGKKRNAIDQALFRARATLREHLA